MQAANHKHIARVITALGVAGAIFLAAVSDHGGQPTGLYSPRAVALDPGSATDSALLPDPLREELSTERVDGDGPDGGLFSLRPGTRLEFELEAGVSTVMSVPDDQTGRGVSFEISALGLITSVATREEQTLLLLQLEDIDIQVRAAMGTGDDRHERAMAAALERPIELLLRRDGEHLGYRFHDEVPPEAEAWCRSLLSSMRFVDRPGEHEWETVETDSTGTFEVSYRRRVAGEQEHQELERRKLRILGGPEGMPQLDIPELQCVASASFSDDRGWFDQAISTESMRALIPGTEFRVAFDASFAWVLQAVAYVDLTALPEADWDSPWASPSGSADAGAAAPDAAMAILRAEIKGKSLTDLVDELALALESKGPRSAEMFQAIRRLSALLITDPTALAALPDLLGALPADVAVAVLAAVARAGTPEAQALLAALATSPETPHSLRDAAAKMMFALETPNAATLAAAKQLTMDPDPNISSTATLLLGALANRTSSPEVMNDLLAAEGALAQDGKSGLWLEALGNSAHPAVVDAVQPYLQSEDSSIRESAVLSLRHLQGEQVSQSLAAAALNDVDASIRMDAVSILAAQSDATALATLTQVLQQEEDAGIRKQAISGVAQQASGSAQALAVLKSAAINDPSTQNQAYAQQLLGQME